jgi:hypothetical protein
MSKWFVLLIGLGFGAVALVRYRTMKECERQLDYHIGRLAPLALEFALKSQQKEGSTNVAQSSRKTA